MASCSLSRLCFLQFLYTRRRPPPDQGLVLHPLFSFALSKLLQNALPLLYFLPRSLIFTVVYVFHLRSSASGLHLPPPSALPGSTSLSPSTSTVLTPKTIRKLRSPSSRPPHLYPLLLQGMMSNAMAPPSVYPPIAPLMLIRHFHPFYIWLKVSSALRIPHTWNGTNQSLVFFSPIQII